MLILTRKVNQQITIGDDITLVVLEIVGGKVRLGLEAPRDVPIFRRELLTGNDGRNGQPKEER